MPVVWKTDQGAWYIADLKLRKPRYWITDDDGQRWFHSRDLKRGHPLTQSEMDELAKTIRLSLVFDLPPISLPFDLRPTGARFGKPATTDLPHGKTAIGKALSTNTIDPRSERQIRNDKLRKNLHSLYAWQEAAYTAWRDIGRVGVVEAATGTGKTRLAFEAIADGCLDKYRVLVLVPTIPLLEQWIAELKVGFGESLRIGRFDGKIHDSFLGHDVIVASVSSACRHPVQALGDDGKTLLIADEVHHYGAPTFAKALVDRFSWRLSLTATFSRNDDGIKRTLLPYFKGVCFRYSLKDAVADNIVARYELTWLCTRFPQNLMERYDDLSKRLKNAKNVLVDTHRIPESPFGEFLKEVTRAAADTSDSAHSAAKDYIFCFSERRKMLSEFEGKYKAIAALEDWFSRSDRSLVFGLTQACAEESARIIDNLGFGVRVVHSGLSRDERSYALAEFKRGSIKIVCAPLVLDEGIDVPAADFAIVMAANRSERQFIQRIGRVIRRKKDGHSARVIIMYVKGTLEDPATPFSESVYGDIVEGADVVRHFEFDGIRLTRTDMYAKRAISSPPKQRAPKTARAILIKAPHSPVASTYAGSEPLRIHGQPILKDPTK